MPAHRTNPPGSRPPVPGTCTALLDRWPFRRKLDVVVFVPVLVVAAMLALLGYQQVGFARTAAETARLVRDSEQVAKLIEDLQTEHRQALLVSLRYEALDPDSTGTPDTAGYLTAQQDVNSEVTAVRATFGKHLTAPEAEALKEIEGLDSLRSTIEQGPIPADNIDPAYDGAVADLINCLGINGPGDPDSDGDSDSSDVSGEAPVGPGPAPEANLADAGSDAEADAEDTGDMPRSSAALSGTSATLLDALLRADTAHATFETSVFAARTGDANALIEFTSAVGAYDQYHYQVDRFQRHATRSQGYELAGIERSAYQSMITQQYASLEVDPSGLVTENPDQVRTALGKALKDEGTYYLQAQGRLQITRSLIGQIATQTQTASDDAWWRAGLLLLATLVAFTAWLLFCVLARRSVLRTVRTLTGAAQRVAEATGQELARVADDAADAGPPRLAAVPVPVRDEIGELAEAFNQVQLTATALLERQVLSRRNIAEMFGNVGRRVSNLTARQLALIDAVERGETDPAMLERLYRIDHIAVRLQRNADSLMLLAGLRETGTGSGPVRLSNIVRAALGKIEGYQRVTPRADGDVTVTPDVVGDLTLMLSELLENAVMFSPASSRVEVRLRVGAAGAGSGDGGAAAGLDADADADAGAGAGTGADAGAGAGVETGDGEDDGSGVARAEGVPVGGVATGRLTAGGVPVGAVVQIVDHGLGMSTERLAEENARLVRRERLDLVPTKVLGLFVVGSLSRRWGIRVVLTRTQGGGVTATVSIPPVHLLPTHSAPSDRSRNAASPSALAARAQAPALAPGRRTEPKVPAAQPWQSHPGWPAPWPIGPASASAPGSPRTDDPPTTAAGLPRRVPSRTTGLPVRTVRGEGNGDGGIRGDGVNHDGGLRDELSPQRTRSQGAGALGHASGSGGLAAWARGATGTPQPPGGMDEQLPDALGPSDEPEIQGMSEAQGIHAKQGIRETQGISETAGMTGTTGTTGIPDATGTEANGRAGTQGMTVPPAAPSPEGEAARDPSPTPPAPSPTTPSSPTASAPPTSAPPAGRAQVPGAQSPRPLRRRVRGATLSATTASCVLPPSSAPQGAPAEWRPMNAEAVRAELDEFESAVERAQRDCSRYLYGLPYDHERLIRDTDVTDVTDVTGLAGLTESSSEPRPTGLWQPPARRVPGTDTSPSSSSEGMGQ